MLSFQISSFGFKSFDKFHRSPNHNSNICLDFDKFLSYPYFMRIPCYQHICIILLPCQIHQKPPWVQHFAVSQAPHFLTFWKEDIFNFSLHSNFLHLILRKSLRIDNKYQNKYLTYFSPNIFVGNFVKLWTVSKSGALADWRHLRGWRSLTSRRPQISWEICNQ